MSGKSISCFLSALGMAFISAGVSAAEPVFEADIRPILKANCFHCHGEDDKKEGQLDVRLVRLMQHGGDSGAAISIDDPAKSLLLARIVSGEMPPGEKKLTSHQIELIRRWLSNGARTAQPEPNEPPASDIVDEERKFWSFQPIQSSAIPQLDVDRHCQSPIDHFLLQKLCDHHLEFSESADRTTLIRRMTFDLHGLPPSIESIQEFAADRSPDATERLIDRLLASPHYGERWGRHWLDVAGYADSDGYTESDPVRKYAYKFRDYVINAMNSDKPIDQFVIEQLAGDELVDLPYENLSGLAAEKLAATGFLRMAADGTGAGGVDQNVARNDVIAESIKVVSTSLLGLTVGCAQCHNHRYDPIPQVDYYRFRALFEPAYDWKNWRGPQQRLISLWSADQLKLAQTVDADVKTQSEVRQKELDIIVQEVFEREVQKLPEEQRETVRAARSLAADKRTTEQTQLLKDHPSLNVDRGSVYLYEAQRVADFNKNWDQRINEIKAKRPAEDFVPCLTEVAGKTPATHLFYRGEFSQPRQEVTPAELSVLAGPENAEIPFDDPKLPSTGRRLAYARHLTNGRHPLLARVLANRIWLLHFGKGIVATPGDFGTLGERPSHPELLDWLASRLMQDGWQGKKFQRLILSSTAIQQQSFRRPELDAIDSDNRLLGRMSVRRLEAEAIRDSVLACSGALSDKMTGPPTPVAVDDVGQVVVGVDTRDSAGRPTDQSMKVGEDEFRRSVYIQVRRSLPLGMLEPFDMATLAPNCELRSSSTVAPQALLMMNNEMVLAEANRFAQRIHNEVGENPADQVVRAWSIAFGRTPTADQINSSLQFLSVQAKQLSERIPADQVSKEPPAAQQALATLCQALLSSNPFLYID